MKQANLQSSIYKNLTANFKFAIIKISKTAHPAPERGPGGAFF